MCSELRFRTAAVARYSEPPFADFEAVVRLPSACCNWSEENLRKLWLLPPDICRSPCCSSIYGVVLGNQVFSGRWLNRLQLATDRRNPGVGYFFNSGLLQISQLGISLVLPGRLKVQIQLGSLLAAHRLPEGTA